MATLIKKVESVERNVTAYYRKDGTKKYKHYNTNGYESWWEFNSKGLPIYMKNSDGEEWWSADNPNNPNNKVEEVEVEVEGKAGVEVEESDIRPFEFSK